MTEAAANLVDFLRDLATHLALGTELDMGEIRPALDTVKASLQDTWRRYQEPAPEGAEAIRDFMLEALELFHGAVEGIEAFLDHGDRARLAESAAQAEEADDILSSVEYVIQQNQHLLSGFSVG